jgi:Helix-hairpin-helix domain
VAVRGGAVPGVVFHNDQFRMRSYEKAAKAVAGYPDDLGALPEKGLTGMPGVGSSVAAKIAVPAGGFRLSPGLSTSVSCFTSYSHPGGSAGFLHLQPDLAVTICSDQIVALQDCVVIDKIRGYDAKAGASLTDRSLKLPCIQEPGCADNGIAGQTNLVTYHWPYVDGCPNLDFESVGIGAVVTF